MTQDVPAQRHCGACGGLVDVEANFCPTCGTRQIDGVPREPVPTVPTPDPDPAPAAVATTPVTPAAASATAAWMVIGILVGAFVLAFLALLTSRVFLRGGHDAGTPIARPASTAGPAAAAMDRFAPIEAGWRAKHAHVADEGDGADSAGLATAAGDAHAWVDVNSTDLDAAARGVPGASGRLYQQLIDIYARRYAVLADVQSTAGAGGTRRGAGRAEPPRHPGRRHGLRHRPRDDRRGRPAHRPHHDGDGRPLLTAARSRRRRRVAMPATSRSPGYCSFIGRAAPGPRRAAPGR